MAYGRQLLMIPGPVPVPEKALQAMSRPMINHRGSEFGGIYKRVHEGVQWLYRTKQDVYFISGSGSTGLEAAIVNIVSPGDRVLALVTGVFGERFAKMAQTYGGQVERITTPHGIAVTPEQVEAFLSQHPKGTYKAVLVTHNETSTGVLNPLQAIAEVCRKYDSLVLVDAVSSLGATDLRTDEWGLDVVVSGSQKAFMVPPGLAFMSMNERAWEAYAQCKTPRFTLDAAKMKDFHSKHQTPWTPPVSIFFALEAVLPMMQGEGLEAIFARHAQWRQMVRSAISALGLELLVKDEAAASASLTSVLGPQGIDVNAFRKMMADQFNIILAGGQGDLKDSIFRIGHLGYQSTPDLLAVIGCLELCLQQIGYPVQLGTGVSAFQQAWGGQKSPELAIAR